MLQPIRTSQRRGFTLIELLVVIAIISILLALLLPAVQAAREAARRMACRNNVKQLALAAHNYHDCHNTLPPGAVGPLTPAFPQYLTLKSHGLGTYLLPYVEQQPLASQYCWDVSWNETQNQPVANTQLQIWKCPSAPRDRIQDGMLTTETPPPVEKFSGTGACGDYAGMSFVDKELVVRGVITLTGQLNERGHFDGVFDVNSVRPLRDITDGSSQTILIAEGAGRPNLHYGRNEVSGKWVSGGPWASRNLLWCRGATTDGSAPYGTCAINCTNNREMYSFHAGGANAAFADGSVHFLSASIDIQAFANLVTCAGGDVVSERGF
jgi:prepilin-type N-terminal cleavage/methylation domain-containing protein/prepilin-type processing-associated H-X9-DG protein